MASVAQHSWKNPLRAYSAGVMPVARTNRSPTFVTATSCETTKRTSTAAASPSIVSTSRTPNVPWRSVSQAVASVAVRRTAIPMTNSRTRPACPMTESRSMSGLTNSAKTASPAWRSRRVPTMKGAATSAARSPRTIFDTWCRSATAWTIGSKIRHAESDVAALAPVRRIQRIGVASKTEPVRWYSTPPPIRAAMAAALDAASQGLARRMSMPIGRSDASSKPRAPMVS